MSNLAQAPLFVFALTFSALLLAAWAGVCLRKKWPETEAKLHDDFGIILAATLTLLALIIGFSFSMATARYDQRKPSLDARAIGSITLTTFRFRANNAGVLDNALRG